MSLLDKKSRTSIMYGVIICLTIAIIFCVIRIATRPVEVKEDTNFYLPVKEKVDMSEIEKKAEEQQDREVHIEVEDRARLIEDNVNIRSGPGTDYERLGSAYRGFDYKILSPESNVWIKIEYDDRPAYVYAEYVEVVPMFLNDMGEYEEYVTMDDNAAHNKSEETEETTEEESEEESEGEEPDTE